MNYPWYEQVQGPSIDQGDCLFSLPIIRPRYDPVILTDSVEEKPIDTSIEYRDCIVMTQGCDLAYEKVDEVILCPIQDVAGFRNANPTYQSKKSIQRILRGSEPALHLLNSSDESDMEMTVVSFRQVFSVPTEYVEGFAESKGARPRLLPPYREHLSQAFARYFMRVGLPQDIELE